MRIPRTLSTLLLISAVASCGRSGPSDFFRSLDTDDDGSVNLEEWMSYYGPHDHPWEDCAGHDFEPADCNGDLRLTWPEYHSARFKSDYCDDPQAHLTIYRKPEFDHTNGQYLTLPPACRISLSTAAQQASAAIAATGSTPSICETYGVTR